MVGRQVDGEYYQENRRTAPDPEPLVEVRGLRAGKLRRGLDLTIRRGEVVSLLGVQDSGREDVARALFGAVAATGEVWLAGGRVDLRSPTKTVAAGIGYLPSERKVDGAVLSLSVADNMVLAHQSQARTGVLVSAAKKRAVVAEWIERLRIKVPSQETPMASLSGGNQQKVVLAKWLMDPDLKFMILETPTRGLDIGAKADVYGLVRDLSDRGVCVLLLADTLEEGIGMGHRVITMKDGEISGEFDCVAACPTRAEVLERMV